MTAPVKKYGIGTLNIAMFENTNEEGKVNPSFKIDKRYKDKTEEWKSTNTLFVNDLYLLSHLITKVIHDQVREFSNKETKENNPVTTEEVKALFPEQPNGEETKAPF